MWCTFGIGPVEDGARRLGLLLGPFQDRRATPNVGILFLDFRGASSGDERAEIGLQAAEGDQISVCLQKDALEGVLLVTAATPEVRDPYEQTAQERPHFVRC